MGITRDSRHKHRQTGGRVNVHQKKRKFELARPAAMTKLGSKIVRSVRTMGGNHKFRGLRIDAGNFSWGSSAVTRKCRILDVVYNATNSELVRTKSITKNTIVQIDASPFKQYYLQKYGIELGKKKKGAKGEESKAADVKKSKHVISKLAKRAKKMTVDAAIDDQCATGRVLAAISSRPGQCGRADGYILEGPELIFYKKKMEKKKKA